MTNWNLHVPTNDNVLQKYKCGLVAGQRVALRKELEIHDHQGNPTGKVYPKGELWIVLPGILSDPVLWFQNGDGDRHTWDDDAVSVSEWFEIIDSEHAK